MSFCKRTRQPASEWLKKIWTEANEEKKAVGRKRSRIRTNGSRPPAAGAGLLGKQALPAALASTALASVLRRGHPPRTPANAA
jgi:hypothetical protein